MMQNKRQEWSFDSTLAARILLLVELVVLLISTSAAVGVEFLLYLVFIMGGAARSKLVQSFKQPVVFMGLAWGTVLVVGTLYSEGVPSETFDNLLSWRKLLLLPMAVAVFDSKVWKLRLIWTLVTVVTMGVGISYFSWFTGVTFYKLPLGIVIHNHATQGMVFAVSIFTMALMMRYAPPVASGWRWFLIIAALGATINLIFITPGRSGYLALLVLVGVTAFFWTQGKKFSYLAGFGVTAMLALLLFFSPMASQRIAQGIDEITESDHSAELTSMGVRMVMWKNTINLVKERPWIGYGTGGFFAGYRHQVAGVEGWRGQVVGDPHNQFLRIAAEQGLIGLGIFLFFLGSFFRQQVVQPYRIMGLGVLLAWCATSMFSSHFTTFFAGRFLFLWCGALLSQQTEEN